MAKKETKIEELERRIKVLEKVSHEQYIGPCPYPHYPQMQYQQQMQQNPTYPPGTVIC